LGGVNFSTLSGLSTGAATATTTGGATASQTVNSTLTGTIVDQPSAGKPGGLLSGGYVNAAFGGTGLNLGVITNNVGVFVTALEGVTDTTVLANPKVLVLNKQQGEVLIGQELGYKTAVTTDTLTASTVQFLDTGTHLIFRPYIGDNGYIRLEVHPEDSTGNLDANGNPSKNTTEVTSDLLVKDGRTVVIGGLFRDATTRTRNQVPFLGSLPGVGPLFRQQTDATQREEIIILLTPHIVKDMDQYANASEEEAKMVDRIEVGSRRGLMPFGRERLAESWYEMAVQEMNKPHPNRQLALWHLNCAINLNPMFSEAMELRSQITGKELTATDDSTIRSFVKRQVLAERAYPATEPASASEVPIDAPTAKADDKKPAVKVESAVAAGPAPATQPAEAKLDTQPTTQPGSDVTATTNNPSDPFEPAPVPSDDKK
jgi:type IV pilus assembly protein PilQ